MIIIFITAIIALTIVVVPVCIALSKIVTQLINSNKKMHFFQDYKEIIDDIIKEGH